MIIFRNSIKDRWDYISLYQPSKVKNILLIDSRYGKLMKGSDSLWYKLLSHQNQHVRILAYSICVTQWNTDLESTQEIFYLVKNILIKLQDQEPSSNFIEQCLVLKIMKKMSPFAPLSYMLLSKFLNHKDQKQLRENKLILQPSTYLDWNPPSKSYVAVPAVRKSILKGLCKYFFKIDVLPDHLSELIVETIFPEDRNPLNTVVFICNNTWIWELILAISYGNNNA